MEKTNLKWMEDTIDALGIVAATAECVAGLPVGTGTNPDDDASAEAIGALADFLRRKLELLEAAL